ncbi:hypothetical protein BDV36DRAFT_180956 [Aspergillus pseudocaelatus]|uniref:F-box domain-containing protein n=1 Tax=Aspergillus pseudocaelatus TaxID=1825620 RepID=A0ABQ6WL82_9EURO|nr:hypothetical protein BDV36DRAFT_180956 [Aspergillus pseudocaelatus]
MATNRSRLHLYSLPNEVFVQILSPLPTHSLLPLTTVSHRFYALILRILHYRILVSVSLSEYNLMLDCLNPSSYSTEPHVFCKYLGTDGLSNQYEGKGSLYENIDTAQQLGRLGSLYSRFRPSVVVMQSIGGARRFSSAGRASAGRCIVQLNADCVESQPGASGQLSRDTSYASRDIRKFHPIMYSRECSRSDVGE